MIETDAPCKHCGDEHGYVTKACNLVVYVDYGSARWVARAIEGAVVRPIEKVPDGIDYMLDVTKNGRPDPNLPRHAGALSRG